MKKPSSSSSPAPKLGVIEARSTIPRAKRGWHSAPFAIAPHRGKGSATVEPIRELSDIARIKGGLADCPRDLSLFVFGIHAGLRGSDLLSLRWADVLDDESSIRDRISVRESKTGNMRHIALHSKVKLVLESWLRNSIAETGGEYSPNSFIWPGKSGRQLTIQRLHQLVNYWCTTIGLRGNFGTHTLRKTYGYHLRRLGYDIELLMKIFGHSSASITLRYIGVEQEEIDEANLKLIL